MFRRVPIFISLFIVVLSLPRVGRAQNLAAWEAANAIRDAGVTAQTKLYAAQRVDDPSAHIAEAVLALDDAETLYTENLAPHFGEVAPEADAAITTALEQAHEAAQQNDLPGLAAARGQIWTGLLWGAYDAALDALAAGDSDAAGEWLRMREYRQATKVNVVNSPAADALTGLGQGTVSAQDALLAAGNDLRDTYFFRLRDSLNELDAAAIKKFVVRAAEWAGQARGYFAILHQDFADKQGIDAAQQVSEQLAELEMAAVEGDWVRLPEALAAVQALIKNYQPVDLSAGAIDQRTQLLYLFTELVYVEYKDGVRNGEITNEIEYREAVTFRDQAAALLQELHPVIAQRDAAIADRLSVLFDEMDAIITTYGEPAEIQVRVDEALAVVESTLDVSPDSDQASAFIVIDTLLDELVLAVRQGAYDDAERLRLEAYAMYDSGPELRLVPRAPRLGRDIEGMFWEGTDGEKGLAVLLHERAPLDDVQAQVGVIESKLAEAETLLDSELNGWLTMLNSAAIIIREGLEAVLVIGVILGYMRATGSPRRFSAWVYAGVAAAILLSLVTWWAAEQVITITVRNRELLEGITSLIAVGVLFFVTNWIFHKTYVVDWISFVREKVGTALTSGSALTLAGLGFTVVYREGFETVLFYQALLFDADPLPTAIGFVAGSVLILVVAVIILRMSRRLPLKPFFTVTTVVMLLLAFNFTGAGVRELQEAGVIGATLVSAVPENLILIELLGIYPTLETILAQVFFVAAVLVTFTYSRWQGAQKTSPATS